MLKVTVTTRTGEERVLDALPRKTLMETIRDAGIDELLALCGGVCSCATCHVYVDSAFVSKVSPIGEDENDILDGSTHRKETSRLSCQIRLTDGLDGLRVTIAPED